MTADQPVIAVVFDAGAVSAAEIAVGLTDVGQPLFLVPDTPHTSHLRPVLAQLGKVLPVTGALDDVRREAPDAIMTFSEQMLPATAELAAALGLPFHDVATVTLLTDKRRQRAALREAGIDDVRQYPLRRAEDWPAAVAAVELPAIIKPLIGGGSRDTFRVDEAEQGQALADQVFAQPATAGPFVVEEFIAGRPSLPFSDLVSVESLCSPSGFGHLAVSSYLPLVPPFILTGRFWPCHLPDAEQQEIVALTDRALTALGVRHGVTHTEIKLTPAGPRIIEVNGRMGGHVNDIARAACGVDMVQVAARLAGGEPIEFPRLRPDRVHFQYHTPAPFRPARMVAMHGAAEARRLPGVTGYRVFVRAGEQLDGAVRIREMDFAWGACDDYDDMHRTLAALRRTLSYDFEFDGVVRRVHAAELSGAHDEVGVRD